MQSTITGNTRHYREQIAPTFISGEHIHMQLIGKLLGDANKRDLKAIQPLVDKINALEPAMKKLSDTELAAKTAEFRSQLALYLKGGMVLEDELVKLFREVLTKVEPQTDFCTDADLHT